MKINYIIFLQDYVMTCLHYITTVKCLHYKHHQMYQVEMEHHYQYLLAINRLQPLFLWLLLIKSKKVNFNCQIMIYYPVNNNITPIYNLYILHTANAKFSLKNTMSLLLELIDTFFNSVNNYNKMSYFNILIL